MPYKLCQRRKHLLPKPKDQDKKEQNVLTLLFPLNANKSIVG